MVVMLVVIVVLMLAVRGAVAVLRDVQSCFSRREEGAAARQGQHEPLLPAPQQEQQRDEPLARTPAAAIFQGPTEGPWPPAPSAGAEPPPPTPPPQPAGRAN